MNSNTNKPSKNKSIDVENSLQTTSNSLVDVKIAKLQTSADTQQKINNTGLPNRLKSGIENLSGIVMDDVTVHYNSEKPTQLQAHAYAQANDIHLSTDKEKNLPLEVWHVVKSNKEE